MANQKPGGIPEGAEIVFLSNPASGWVSNSTGSNNSTHYLASIEGRMGGIGKESQNNIAESASISLWRKEHAGQIAPGPVFFSLTDASITDLPLNGVGSSTGFHFVVLANGRLLRVALNFASVSNHWDAPGTPVSSKNGDIISMFDLASTQKEAILWTYETSSSADVEVFYNAAVIDNWLSLLTSPITLTVGKPHKLLQGQDANVYITDAGNLYQIVVNGAINDYTKTIKGNVLNVGANITLNSSVNYKNYIATGGYLSASYATGAERGGVRVFLWDGLSSTINGVTSVAANFKYEIPDNFLNSLYCDGTTLFAFTSGRNNSSKIWELTGSGFRKVFETPLIGVSATPIQGNIDNYQDGLIIGAIKNGESPYIFRYNGGFHCESLLTDGTNTATDVGMVKNLFTDWITAGVKYVSGGSPVYALFYSQNANYQVGASLRSILYTQGILGRRMYPLGFKGTMNRILIYLAQWGTGASIHLGLYAGYSTYNGAGNDLLDLTIDTDTSTPNSINHKAYPVGTAEIDISDVAIPNLSTFYIILTFNHASISNTAAIIRSLVMFWSPSQ